MCAIYHGLRHSSIPSQTHYASPAHETLRCTHPRHDGYPSRHPCCAAIQFPRVLCQPSSLPEIPVAKRTAVPWDCPFFMPFSARGRTGPRAPDPGQRPTVRVYTRFRYGVCGSHRPFSATRLQHSSFCRSNHLDRGAETGPIGGPRSPEDTPRRDAAPLARPRSLIAIQMGETMRDPVKRRSAGNRTARMCHHAHLSPAELRPAPAPPRRRMSPAWDLPVSPAEG